SKHPGVKVNFVKHQLFNSDGERIDEQVLSQFENEVKKGLRKNKRLHDAQQRVDEISSSSLHSLLKTTME
ncbi:hypothetical protein Tco_1520811, partial [Tanacetum coccineum]